MLSLQSLFTIEPSNGSISMRGQLDRETVEEVTIKVFVEDINAIGTRLQNATGELTHCNLSFFIPVAPKIILTILPINLVVVTRAIFGKFLLDHLQLVGPD